MNKCIVSFGELSIGEWFYCRIYDSIFIKNSDNKYEDEFGRQFFIVDSKVNNWIVKLLM